MPRIIILTDKPETARRLRSALVQNGFTCAIAANPDELRDQVTKQPPDLLLSAADSRENMPAIIEIAHNAVPRRRAQAPGRMARLLPGS